MLYQTIEMKSKVMFNFLFSVVSNPFHPFTPISFHISMLCSKPKLKVHTYMLYTVHWSIMKMLTFHFLSFSLVGPSFCIVTRMKMKTSKSRLLWLFSLFLCFLLTHSSDVYRILLQLCWQTIADQCQKVHSFFPKISIYSKGNLYDFHTLFVIFMFV